MKSFFVIAVLVAAVSALPQAYDRDDRIAVIVNQQLDNIGVEGFSHRSETSNGISQQAQGQLVDAGTENEALVIRGQYSYTAPDGLVYTITYIADRNGYRAEGAHLPVAPQ